MRMEIDFSILLQGLLSAIPAIAILKWWRPSIVRQRNLSTCLAVISIMGSNRTLLPNFRKSLRGRKKRGFSLVIQALKPLRQLLNWHVIIPNGLGFWRFLALFMGGRWEPSLSRLTNGSSKR